MKLAKLSLAAIVVAGLTSSVFAADSLEGAFKEGKVSGELRAFYFDRERTAGDADIFNAGMMLNYKTGSFYGFGANFTAQGNGAPFADKEAKASTFKSDEYGSGAQLSEAYISYTMKNTTVLVGRMFLDTPLVASSGSRITKQAFQGAAVINTDLPNTTLIAGYVNKFQDRTDGKGNIGEFASIGDDGAYTLAVINKSIAGLTLTGAYADVIDVIQVAYAEAAYEGKASSFTYGLAAQYYFNDSDTAGVSNSGLWGLKGTVGINAFTAMAAYSKVTEKTVGINPGLGGGADLAYTASPLNSNSYGADTEAYKLGASYALLKNANVGVSYTVNEYGTKKDTFTAVEGDYACEGALKGLTLSAIYEDGGKDAKNVDELWVKAIYKF